MSLCTTAGKAKYDPKKHALVWKLKRFVGQSEHAMAATVELIATTREKKPWARPPIGMQFQVGFPYYATLQCICGFVADLSRGLCPPKCIKQHGLRIHTRDHAPVALGADWVHAVCSSVSRHAPEALASAFATWHSSALSGCSRPAPPYIRLRVSVQSHQLIL